MYDVQSETTDKPVLIIPAAGKSSRYPNMKPKWMLTHPSGSLMIEKVVAGIDLNAYKKVYIVVLQEHCQQYEADIILRQAFSSDKFEIVILDSPTHSSPETVYKCIQIADIHGWIVVKDCDCLVSFDLPKNNRFVVGLSIKDHDIKNLSQKSFIIHDQNGVVFEVIEKRVASNCICVGVYAIHTDDLITSYERLSSVMSNELYFSHIVSDVIENTVHSFYCVEAKKYEDWGTKDDWFSSSNLKNTYFVDIDGVLMNNTGRYGSKNWYNTLEPIESNVSVIKKLSDQGHEIVFITSRSSDALTPIKNFLESREIRYKTILSDCLHSKRIIVNDFANSNPFPSCLAINVPRNGDIEPYMTNQY